jgi:GNAT superfamily N-acetyltransferase
LDYTISFQELLENKSVRSQLQSLYPMGPNSDVLFKIQETPDELYLGMVLVPAKKRGKGLADKFMKKMIQLAKENGLKRIRLNVSDAYSDDMSNEDLIKWYKKYGFKLVNKTTNEMILKL